MDQTVYCSLCGKETSAIVMKICHACANEQTSAARQTEWDAKTHAGKALAHLESWANPTHYTFSSAKAAFVLKALRDVISSAPVSEQNKNEWRESVLVLCAVRHLPFYEENPKKTLDNILTWEVDVALDPTVNGGKVLVDIEAKDQDKKRLHWAIRNLTNNANLFVCCMLKLATVKNGAIDRSHVTDEMIEEETLRYIDEHIDSCEVVTGNLAKKIAAQFTEFLRTVLKQDNKDAERYRALRAMHWTESEFCVIRVQDLNPGVQTYTNDFLDEELDAVIAKRQS